MRISVWYSEFKGVLAREEIVQALVQTDPELLAQLQTAIAAAERGDDAGESGFYRKGEGFYTGLVAIIAILPR